MTQQSPTTRTFESIAIIILGYLFFSITDMMQKYLGSLGFSVHTILAYCAASSLIFSVLSILVMRGPRGFIPQKSKILHFIRSLLLILGSFGIVNSLQLIPLAQFYGIVFSVPFMISFGAILMFKEHPGIQRWLAIIGGFSGVWIVANPDFSNINPGIIWALTGAISIASANLIARKIGPGEFLPIYPFFMHLGILIVNCFFMHEFTMPTITQAGFFLFTGFCLFAALMLVTLAFIIAPLAAIPAPFQYTQIIWGALFGYFIFSEVPDARTLFGISIIICSGIYLIYRENENNKSQNRNRFRNYMRP